MSNVNNTVLTHRKHPLTRSAIRIFGNIVLRATLCLRTEDARLRELLFGFFRIPSLKQHCACAQETLAYASCYSVFLEYRP